MVRNARFFDKSISNQIKYDHSVSIFFLLHDEAMIHIGKFRGDHAETNARLYFVPVEEIYQVWSTM